MTEKIKYCISRLGLTRLKQIAYMSVMLIAVLLVLAFSVNKITVNDGSRVQTLYSLKSQPTELLKMATLSSQSYKVTEVTEKGNKIESSPHPKMLYTVKNTENLKVGDILCGI